MERVSKREARCPRCGSRWSVAEGTIVDAGICDCADRCEGCHGRGRVIWLRPPGDRPTGMDCSDCGGAGFVGGPVGD